MNLQAFTPSDAGLRPDAVDLELYADRLARHADRLADEISAVRLRLSWQLIEQDARTELAADETARLEAVGVLGAPDGTDEDTRLIARRHDQLAAISRIQEIVERKIRQSQ